MARFRALVCIALISAGLLACEQVEKPDPATPASDPDVQSSPGALATRSAADRITDARCDREQRCGHIGAVQSYTSHEHCMSILLPDAKKSVAACPDGLDTEEVDACVAAVAQQDCRGAFDTLDRYAACQGDELCQD